MQLSAGKQGGRCKIGPLAGRQATNNVGQVMGVALHEALLCQVQQEGHARGRIAKAAKCPDDARQVSGRQPRPPVSKSLLQQPGAHEFVTICLKHLSKQGL